ncbi:MAG TPA: hypothetical protein VGU64_09725 [Terriglobales bacterium]|nr:hypothetical protein [Terriglobales bacterium]
MSPLSSLPARLTAGLFVLVSFSSLIASQQVAAPLSNISSISPALVNLDRSAPLSEANVIQQFIETEIKQREALNQHTFKRDVVLQTIGPNGNVTGEYIRNSQFLFDDKGKRIERVLYHPASTIHEMRITREDIQDLAGSQLFGVDITELSKYQFKVVAPDRLGSGGLIAIDVTPSIQPDPQRMAERFFVGRIWIDPNTFQVVKTDGSVEPQGKQRFPHFETWREPINSVFVFPVRTSADDILHFPARDVHYRISVRYYDYKLFACEVSVKEVDDVPPSE